MNMQGSSRSVGRHVGGVGRWVAVFSIGALVACGGQGTPAGGGTSASASVAASNVGNTSAQAGGQPAAAGTVPASCNTPPNGNIYVALAEHRPDVLRFYAQNGWNTETQCKQAYDDWLSHGPDGKAPTTAAAFVSANGWSIGGAATTASSTTTK